MSRVGRMPVVIPQDVEVFIEGNLVRVKGPKGELERTFHPEMNVSVEDNSILVRRLGDEKKERALHGLTRALLNNMVIGVTQGFQRNLELVGVGYRASKQGNKLVLTVGYSHPVEMDPGSDLEIEVATPTRIAVRGINKEAVGEFAARIRRVREPEPYKGKGIRYEGEKVRRKVGKTGAKK